MTKVLLPPYVWWRQAWWWLLDYGYMVRGHGQWLTGRRAYGALRRRTHSRGAGLLIPGIFEGRYFMMPLARRLAKLGYDVHILPVDALNVRPPEQQAEHIHEYLERQGLLGTDIVGHSKGGLDALAYVRLHPRDRRVRRVVAVAAPFNGTTLSRYIPLASVRLLAADGEAARAVARTDLKAGRVVSIAPAWDNHIWHTSGSYLVMAANISLRVYGHHRILFTPELARTIDAVLREDILK